jgi:hypothetical protein
MIIDKSLHFGLQNFICVAVDETSDPVHNFYGYQNKKGMVLIMRTDKTTSELLYYVSVLAFAGVWAGRVGYTYVLPTELIDPSVNP